MRAIPELVWVLSADTLEFADLDGDRSRGKQLAGWWDLGWSIGVPTEVFRDVSPGEHDVTFELLPASKSSHPASKNVDFRLIGLIST